jgi:hypothetical protein
MPLLDSAVPDADLASWLDAHTMRVHGFLLDRLSTLQQDPGAGRRALVAELRVAEAALQQNGGDSRPVAAAVPGSPPPPPAA